MEGKNEGENIINVFKYIMNFYDDVSLLFKDIDELMGDNDWYANKTEVTSEMSYSLNNPSKWLSKYTFRVYENEEEIPEVYRAVMAVYKWKDRIKEPIVVLAKIEGVSSTFHPLHFWLTQETPNPNGEIISGHADEKLFKKTLDIFEEYDYSWTAIPLLSINNKKDIKEEVVDRLLSDL